jgi:hypothetical protein
MLLQIFEERDSFHFITVKIAKEIEQVLTLFKVDPQ